MNVIGTLCSSKLVNKSNNITVLAGLTWYCECLISIFRTCINIFGIVLATHCLVLEVKLMPVKFFSVIHKLFKSFPHSQW